MPAAANLRLSLAADAPAKLVVVMHRTDIAAGEPGDLQRFVDLKPGESITLPVYERSIITIAEQSAAEQQVA